MISQAGRPEDGTDPKTDQHGRVLRGPEAAGGMDAEDHPRGAVGADGRRRSTRFPGLEPAISQPIRDNVLESISQIDGQIVIKVSATTRRHCGQRSTTCCERSRHVRGVSRAFIDRAGEVPQLQIEVDRAPRRPLRPQRRGRRGRHRDGAWRQGGDRDLGRRAALSAWRCGCASRIGGTSAAISQHARSTRRRGRACRSADVANISVRGGSMNISREAGTRVSAIGVFIRGRDMGGIVEEMRRERRRATSSFRPATTRLWRRIREPAARDDATGDHRARSACS